MRILDDMGREVPTGEVGEVCGRGPLMMAGYYKRPDLTAGPLWAAGSTPAILAPSDVMIRDDLPCPATSPARPSSASSRSGTRRRKAGPGQAAGEGVRAEHALREENDQHKF